MIQAFEKRGQLLQSGKVEASYLYGMYSSQKVYSDKCDTLRNECISAAAKLSAQNQELARESKKIGQRNKDLFKYLLGSATGNVLLLGILLLR